MVGAGAWVVGTGRTGPGVAAGAGVVVGVGQGGAGENWAGGLGRPGGGIPDVDPFTVRPAQHGAG